MQTKTDVGQNDGRQESHNLAVKLTELGTRRLQRAREFELNFDSGLHLQEKIAGILQAPLDIGHLKLRGSLPLVTRDLRMDRDDKIVIGAMEEKHAVQLYIGGTGKCELSIEQRGTENDF